MRARRLTRHLLWIGLPFVASYFLADFSLKLSLALSIIFWFLYARTQQTWEYLAVQERFEPFRVDVAPKWALLLRDYKLVESDEQLDRLFARAEAEPARFKVLSYGFSFTVLRPTPGWIDFRGLLHSNTDNQFVGTVDLWSRVEPPPYDDTQILKTGPSAFVKWGIDGGFDLGIEVDDDWWKQFCETAANKELTTIKTDSDPLRGTVRLVIATLPYAEFGVYLGSVEEYSSKRAEREEQERDRILAKFGWVRDRDAEDLPYGPNEIEHKYFTVWYRAI